MLCPPDADSDFALEWVRKTEPLGNPACAGFALFKFRSSWGIE